MDRGAVTSVGASPTERDSDDLKGETAEAELFPDNLAGTSENICRTVTKVECYHSRPKIPSFAANVGAIQYSRFLIGKEREL